MQLNRLFRIEIASARFAHHSDAARPLSLSASSASAFASVAGIGISSSASTSASASTADSGFTRDIAARLLAGGRVHQIMFTQSEELCRNFRKTFARMLKTATASAAKALSADDQAPPDDASLVASSAAVPIMGNGDDDAKQPPDDFRLLRSEHFPLFVTSNKLLLMLDGSTDDCFFRHGNASSRGVRRFGGDMDASASAAVAASAAALPVAQDHGRDISQMINYAYFERVYWPLLNQVNKRGLSPAVVWTEIQARIRRVPGAELSRADYLQRDVRAGAGLTAGLREQVFHLFEQYAAEKRSRRDFDLSDALAHIHVRLARRRTPAALVPLTAAATVADDFVPIDYVYCDEVQDLLPAQISLLKYLSVSARCGLVLAGDTAQAISAGVSFRFAELKDIFFRELCAPAEASCEAHAAAIVPPLSYLTRNYRSHSGVLDLANTVVQLLHHFFPNRIDALPDEQAPTQGTKPVLIMCKPSSGDASTSSLSDVAASAHDEDSVSAGNHPRDEADHDSDQLLLGITELGAEQIVLVRDQADKALVKQRVSGIVLTIPEAKGLEFRDVLLYNFFSNASAATIQAFRLVYRFMNERLDFPLSASQTPPVFDETKHEQLNLELKLLYVALTRARFNIFIFETAAADGKQHPMQFLWNHLGVVSMVDNVGPSGSGMKKSIAKKRCHPLYSPPQDKLHSPNSTFFSPPLSPLARPISTSEEYRVKAVELFQHEKFDEAALFFERANEPARASEARAHSMLRQAREHALDVRSKMRGSGELELARAIFAQNTAAAKASFRAYEQCALKFRELGFHIHAANAFKCCGLFPEAVESYRAAGKLRQAFDICFECHPPLLEAALAVGEEGRLFRELLEMAFAHRLFLTADSVDRCCSWVAQLQSREPSPETREFCSIWLMAAAHHVLSMVRS